MDTRSLIDQERQKLAHMLQPFRTRCEERGHPLLDMCLTTAYPGDPTTSFNLEVTAKWIDGMDCSDAIDILIDVLWDTVAPEWRAKIFAIFVYTSKQELHCSDQVRPEVRPRRPFEGPDPGNTQYAMTA